MRRSAAALAVMLAVAGCDLVEDERRIVGQLASDRIELAAEFAEPVVTRHVAEGQRVQARELLITQDTARIDARIREAEALARQQRARLDELIRGPRREQIDAARANVAGARRDVEFRRLEYRRALEVHEKELAARDRVDRARAALDAAAAELAVREARLEELLTGTTLEELEQAEQQLAQARARVDALEVDRERHFARAPAAGVVDTLLFERGERPQPGMPLLILLAGAQPHARVYVPEADRVQVTAGTSVRVHVDGLAEPLSGRVRWVSSDAAFTPYFALTEHDRGRLSYVAKIDLDYEGDRLPDGVPVEVGLDRAGNAP